MGVMVRRNDAGASTGGSRDRIERLLVLTLYAVALGYIEATTAAYIRRILGIPPGQGYLAYLAGSSGTIAAEALRKSGLLHIEIAREVASMVVLLAVAWMGGRSFRERAAVFFYSFAVWDMAYYLVLNRLSGFPRSAADTDIYFLIPRVWYGPVWLPALIVMPGMIALALYLAGFSPRRRPDAVDSGSGPRTVKDPARSG